MLENTLDGCKIVPDDVEKLSNFALSLSPEKDDIDIVLKQYQLQINTIHGFLVSSGHTALFNLSDILSQGLDMLIEANRPLTEEECCFLKKIPEFFSEYIFIPSSKISDAHLLNHLKNVHWIRPVTVEEEKKITKILISDTNKNNISEPVPVDNSKKMAESDMDEGIELDLSSFIDTDEIEQTENDLPLSECEDMDTEIADDVLDLSDFMQDTSPEEIEEDVFDLATVEISEDEKVEINFHDETGNEKEIIDKADTAIPNISISDEQQALINLVGDELTDIISTNVVDFDDIAHDEKLTEHLINTAEQVENISNAVDLIGLAGMGDACRYISCNIHTLAINNNKLSDEAVKMLSNWPVIIRNYLQNIADLDASEQLIDYLQSAFWPEPLDADSIKQLACLLKQPEFNEEEKKSRQIKAQQDDMSLALPDDVNADLLDALLQDLPVQTEQFSAAIQNLHLQKNSDYLEIAQRIAHTVKGAGNVVGVKGVANLTHHLEDILEIHSKEKKLPSENLLLLLVDAADCLEAMCEALLGIDAAPDNSMSVFQSVLDWANLLDEKGITGSHPDLPDSDDTFKFITNPVNFSNTDYSNEIDKPKEIDEKPINIESMLRIPVKLADDLLRVAGENLISSSQIQEYIKTIQYRYKILKNHNTILQQLSFDLEHIVDIQGLPSHSIENTPIDEFDSLELDQFHELHSMSRRLVEVASDSIEISKILEKDFSNLQSLVITQAQLQKENEAMVLKTRMVPTKTIIARLKRGVKQVCRLTHKHVDLEVSDNGTYMDSEVLNGLVEPLMHILRNSVDHGIETKEVRELADKIDRGHISLSFNRKGDQIEIIIEDDGKGLSLVKIRDKAFALGLIKDKSEVTKNNLQGFIMQAGFTTRNDVNQISGRGIGLDVVHSKIRELKGSIDIVSTEGKGCRFLISLPVSSFSVHSLLVRVRENIIAISNRGIEEIHYSGLGELQMIGQQMMYKLDGQVYNTYLMDDLLNLPEDRRQDDRSGRPVILVKDDTGNMAAVLVQEVIDSKDVVVKSMGPYVPKIPGIVGATVLGDGSIATVVDLPELKQSINIEPHDVINNVTNQAVIQPRQSYILVVDDSLSARKSLAQFVEDLGLDVRTARDGMEAVALIEKRKPDLVLVDMEMPRMNGLELTTHIRASKQTENLPVIMITSRSTDKHRKVALGKGVSHYMVKPFSEDELAAHITSMLKITNVLKSA